MTYLKWLQSLPFFQVVDENSFFLICKVGSHLKLNKKDGKQITIQKVIGTVTTDLIPVTYDVNSSSDTTFFDQKWIKDSIVNLLVALSIDMKNRHPSILYSSRGFLCPKLLTFT